MHLSNTFSLIKHHGYRSVLIEADKRKFRELQRNMEGLGAIPVNRFVTFDGAGTLDNILSETEIPTNFDVLSIDIDGNDYHILASLKKYRPKIICIEFNPSIPNDVEFVQERNFAVSEGSSALSLTKLASQMGYELAAVTRCNLILVRREYLHTLGLEGNDLAALRDDSDVRVMAFVGYSGTIHLSRPLNLRWHGISVGERDLQVLPRVLRTFPSRYNLGQRLVHIAYLFMKHRPLLMAKVRKTLRKTFSK
jgi:hypothetical protein